MITTTFYHLFQQLKVDIEHEQGTRLTSGSAFWTNTQPNNPDKYALITEAEARFAHRFNYNKLHTF
jgi:hypothetical protein